MAECKICHKPLIVKDGKCAYCGEPIQEGLSRGVKPPKSSWVKNMTTSLTAKKKTWTQTILTQTIISIMVAMLLGILLLVFKPWPGCIVSVVMLVLAIVLTIFSFVVINFDKQETSDADIEQIRENLSHGLNMIQLWGGFMFVVGVVCMFISWWAVLIPSLIGVVGLFFFIRYRGRIRLMILNNGII